MKKVVRVDETKNVRHNLHTWTYAYREARKGVWQREVMDRMRFERRIVKAEAELYKVLSSEHRRKIFVERFVDL